MKIGKCRFCGNRRKLIGAHIIPHAIFKSIRGQDGPLKLYTTWEETPSEKSKGFVDHNLTCGECDNSFSSYENYLVNYIKSQYNTNGERFGNTTALIDKNYNYKEFKLAILATLWRAHETNDEHFANVQLTGASANKIKTMLQNGDPGTEADFPIYVGRIKSDEYNDKLPLLVLDPVSVGECNHEFLMLGWRFIICQNNKDYGPHACLSENQLIAIDYSLEGSQEEEDILKILKMDPKKIDKEITKNRKIPIYVIILFIIIFIWALFIKSNIIKLKH
ncbi:hypothetical protein J4P41_13615 [Gluconobacter sp. NFX36]|uniref:hypothetical protein n=1 Tax=Gluconobacter sp. NFX36 TaxID=2819535 RepID=UPI003CEDB0F3